MILALNSRSPAIVACNTIWRQRLTGPVQRGMAAQAWRRGLCPCRHCAYLTVWPPRAHEDEQEMFPQVVLLRMRHAR